MAVEAARAGEKGRGFRVIVVELQSLNDKTADFSRQIARLLIHFKEDNSALVSDMAGRTELLVGEAEKGMSAAEAAVESLIGAAGDTEAFARRISELALSIDKDLDKVLESLQFQDISRQMLEGALEILREIGENVEAARSRLGAEGTVATGTLAASTLAENRERLERLKREISARSKTQDERDAISEVTL
jgi:methyl-accepting chemotaxis protein